MPTAGVRRAAAGLVAVIATLAVAAPAAAASPKPTPSATASTKAPASAKAPASKAPATKAVANASGSPTPSSSSSPSASDVAKAKAKAKATAEKLAATTAQLKAVQAQLSDLSQKAEIAVTKWEAAQAKAQAAQQVLAQAHTEADAAQLQVDGYRKQLNDYAVAAYMDGGPVADLAALLSATNPEDVLTRSVTLQAIGRGQTRIVTAFVAASQVAGAARDRAAAAATDAQVSTSVADSAKAVASTAVAMAQDLLAKVEVSKAELAAASKKDKKKVDALVAARAAALAAARAAAARVAAARLQQLAVVNGFPEATAGQGQLALKWAETQLGVPYSWGGGDATGPTLGFVESATITSGASTIGFDCSGLALFAWAHAGYALGHYTGAQWVEGTPVPQDQLRPGDLVFFATDTTDPTTIHHVGIYAGNGKMIDAPETGSVVRYDDVFGPGYIGAIRP